MEIKYSPYVFPVDFKQRNCKLLLNTRSGKIAILPIEETILSKEEVDYLKDNGFLFNQPIADDICSNTEDSNDVIISIETSLSCNLSCPYCYQKSVTNRRVSNINFNFVLEYISFLFNQKKFRNFHLKILGGEPSLHTHEIFKFLRNLDEFRKNGMTLHLYFDTNAVLLHRFEGVEKLADTIAFNIPLSHKSVHDMERCKKNGEKTYDQIIQEIQKYHKSSPTSEFVIRHNTNDNYLLFTEFCDDIKSKIPFMNVNICYVVESNVYKNPLGYDNYLVWLYNEAIPLLWKNNLAFVNSPLKKLCECQFYKKYSVKFFSNGTVGRCATDYWASCMSFSDFKNNGYYIDKEKFEIKKECKSCRFIYLCSNSIDYPCRSLIKDNPCIFKTLSDKIVSPFSKLLYESYAKGNMELFVGYYSLKHLV